MEEELDDEVETDSDKIENDSFGVKTSDSQSSTNPFDRQKSPSIELHDGEELTVKTAQLITARSQTRVVVLAGDSESGKTTLLTAIYEKFQRGSFAGFSFAGSQTLMGFERRCWHSRIASNANLPETQRTISGEQNLLHLRLRKNQDKTNVKRDILLFDISGEDFREARTSREVCLQFEVLKRADHLVLLIDGAKIADVNLRHEALRNSRQLLQRFLDLEMLPQKPNINVLFTKYDLIQQQEQDPIIIEFLQSVESTFTENFARRVATLLFYQVAARPTGISQLKFGHGLEEPFSKWIEETPFSSVVSTFPATNPVIAVREFDRYLHRRLYFDA
jgi:GTPase SAR1 family protein